MKVTPLDKLLVANAGVHILVFAHLSNWSHLFLDTKFLMNRLFHHVPIQRNELLQAFRGTGLIFDDLKRKTSTRHCFMRVRE